jgi:hypothetical protein
VVPVPDPLLSRQSLYLHTDTKYRILKKKKKKKVAKTRTAEIKFIRNVGGYIGKDQI